VRVPVRQTLNGVPGSLAAQELGQVGKLAGDGRRRREAGRGVKRTNTANLPLKSPAAMVDALT